MPSDADVIQGRLGWEPGDVSEADPENLSPHPKNAELYGDTESAADLDETFKQSVAEKGVLEPLVITDGKQIISGHRRWVAAKAAGLETAPVRYTEFDSDLAEREALVEFNRQREKTPGQIVNEFEEILAIEKELAKERKEANLKQGDEEPRGGNVSTSGGGGKARDKAAEKVNAGVSGRTLEKGKTVKDKAEQGDDTAQEQWDKLKTGDTSFHRAYKEVEKSEAEKEVEAQQSPDAECPARVRKQDAAGFLQDIGNADLVIADPPYSTDVDDIVGFAKSWLPDAIETIGEDGCAFITIGAYPEELQAYLNVLGRFVNMDRVQTLVWTYRNTLGRTPSDQYKLNWQAILFIQSAPPTDLDSPKTSEQWAVQDINAPDGRFGDRHHKWQKPGELINRFIRHTTDEGDTVVDPFVGTGTTVLEAAKLGRETVGCDVDDDMLDIAVKRGCVRDE